MAWLLNGIAAALEVVKGIGMTVQLGKTCEYLDPILKDLGQDLKPNEERFGVAASEGQGLLHSLLMGFGEDLKSKHCAEGRCLAQKVFNKLQQQSRYSVASVRFGGSFGKKTDVVEPDLDLVIICNSIEPPYDKVLEDFKTVLLTYKDELKINPGTIKNHPRSLNFSFTNGFEVDLLPATNSKNAEEILIKIREDPKKANLYNPSFVEKQIAFLKSQDSFTHTLARLLKLWYKNHYFGENVFGGSAIMELISVAAAEQERENEETLNVARAFGYALDLLSQLHTLKLAFRPVSNGKWKRIPEDELNWNLVPNIVAHPEALRRQYFMIDPANPYQDFLETKSPIVINRFKEFTSATIDVMLGINNYREKVGSELLFSLFQPYPTTLVNEANLSLPNVCCITYEYSTDIICSMQIRKEAVKQDKRKKDTIKVLQQRLFTIVYAVKHNPDTATVADVRAGVENIVKTSLEIGPNSNSHNGMDVTLTIPYKLKGQSQGYAVRFSFSWVRTLGW